MIIERTNSSFGNWMVRVSDTEIKYFWSKKSAEAWMIGRSI